MMDSSPYSAFHFHDDSFFSVAGADIAPISWPDTPDVDPHQLLCPSTSPSPPPPAAAAAVTAKGGVEEEESAGDGVDVAGGSPGPELTRGYRHMMRERQRREKLSQSYADLYAALSPRSKGDKNSIVQTAAARIAELKARRDRLQRRNDELKSKLGGGGGGVRVRFDVPRSPAAASNVDSMIAELQCLRGMDATARSIRTDFAGGRISTAMNLDTKLSASEVEKAVAAAVSGTPAILRWPHVQNVLL